MVEWDSGLLLSDCLSSELEVIDIVVKTASLEEEQQSLDIDLRMTLGRR